MPRNQIDFRHRAQLTELMDEPCSRELMRACLQDLARTNRWTFTHRPTLHWLNTIVDATPHLPSPLRILDVGSGYGDSLREIEQWAAKRRIAVELTGVDLNPDSAVIAAEAGPVSSRIQWVSADIFDYTPAEPVHVVLSSLFTHHLAGADIIRFVRWMEEHATLGWFVNDLSRAPIPYHLFRAFSKVTRMHHFVQHDGPVSIARSFIPEEWRSMCVEAGLREPQFQIESYIPARLCVSRRKRL
jgi:SAM-dependent methyltransferase